MSKQKNIQVGSNAFFSKFEGFKAHDNDTIILEDEPSDYDVQAQIRLNGNCYLKWKRMTPKEYIEYHKKAKVGLFLGKFLVKEFVDEVGFTIEDLKQLSFLLDELDEKHLYEKTIYNAYIENNSFNLTKEQLEKAYNEYKKYR